MSRHDRYASLLARADRYRDAWGHRIDPRIRPVVAALWLHGFPTRWSCEGHLVGPKVPFVTIALDRASERLARTELQRLAEDRRARLQALLDEFVASDPRESSLALTPCHFRSGGLRYVGCAHTLSATLDQSLPNKVSLERAQEAMQGLARFLTV